MMTNLFCNQVPLKTLMRFTVLAAFMLSMSGCSTVAAVADGVGAAAVYGVKTVINAVDAITPDIINKK